MRHTLRLVGLVVAVLTAISVQPSSLDAQDGTLFVAEEKVGIGVATPQETLHIRGTNGTGKILIEETSGGVDELLELNAVGTNGRPRLTFTNPSGTWFYEINGTDFEINRSGTGPPDELRLEQDGDMIISGMLTELSSRSAKEGFTEVDPADVLARVMELPILSWTYTADEARARHVGPMAEDFYRAFELGDGDRHIAPSDKAGVALLAIQGLHGVVEDKDRQIAELKERVARLEALVSGQAADRREE